MNILFCRSIVVNGFRKGINRAITQREIAQMVAPFGPQKVTIYCANDEVIPMEYHGVNENGEMIWS